MMEQLKTSILGYLKVTAVLLFCMSFTANAEGIEDISVTGIRLRDSVSSLRDSGMYEIKHIEANIFDIRRLSDDRLCRVETSEGKIVSIDFADDIFRSGEIWIRWFEKRSWFEKNVSLTPVDKSRIRLTYLLPDKTTLELNFDEFSKEYSDGLLSLPGKD